MTTEPVGPVMAGPAIRTVELGRVLAAEHRVRVVSTSTASSSVEQLPVAAEVVPTGVPAAVHDADVLVVSGDVLAHWPELGGGRACMVADLYDPYHLEQLEQSRSLPPARRAELLAGAARTLEATLRLGDFFVCANERQRALWTGHLAATGRLGPAVHDQDPTLRGLLDVVGFGVPSQPPQPADRPVLRGVHPGVPADAELLVWGGGIYNWFDPVTLVRAVGLLRTARPRLRLIFLGGRHPNPAVPTMAAAVQARQEASRLGLLDEVVVFHDMWVPYADRGAWLSEADLGVTIHDLHVETTFSHRTRVLDYLWAGLPVVTTEGDAMADLIAEAGAGLAVPPRDPEAVAAAVTQLLDDGTAARRAAHVTAAQLTWEAVAGPLLAFCRKPAHAPDLLGRRRSAARAEALSLLRPGPLRRASLLARRVRSEGAAPLVEGVRRRVRPGAHWG